MVLSILTFHEKAAVDAQKYHKKASYYLSYLFRGIYISIVVHVVANGVTTCKGRIYITGGKTFRRFIHCRSWDYIRTILNREPDVVSASRFNIKDLSVDIIVSF